MQPKNHKSLQNNSLTLQIFLHYQKKEAVHGRGQAAARSLCPSTIENDLLHVCSTPSTVVDNPLHIRCPCPRSKMASCMSAAARPLSWTSCCRFLYRFQSWTTLLFLKLCLFRPLNTWQNHTILTLKIIKISKMSPKNIVIK